MLYMAGFYTNFMKSADDEPDEGGLSLTERFIILTRAANASINDIHDRMPVILNKNELVRWLVDDSFVSQVFQRDTIKLVRAAA